MRVNTRWAHTAAATPASTLQLLVKCFNKIAMLCNSVCKLHSRKVFWKYSRLNKRKYWFIQRVVPKWNSLSPEEVEKVSTSEFKKEYDLKEANRMEEIRNYIYVRG